MGARRRWLPALVGLLALAAGCKDEEPPPPVEVELVQIDPETIELEVGEEGELQVSAFDGAGRLLVVGPAQWESSDRSVAEVGEMGALLGLAPGAATITVAVGGKSGHAEVRVIPAKVRSIAVVPGETTLLIDETVQLELQAFDARGAGLAVEEIEWGSTNHLVASVDAAGLVTGHRVGPIRVIASAAGHTAEATVRVLAPISALVIAPASLTLVEGGSGHLVASCYAGSERLGPERCPLPEWSSDAPEVVRVGDGGELHAASPGQALVSALLDGLVGTAIVRVTPKPVSVYIEPSPLIFQVEATLGLQAMVVDSRGGVERGVGCAWSSSSPAIAAVTEGGGLRAIAVGTTGIEVDCGGLLGQESLEVLPRADLSIVGGDRVVVDEEPIFLEASVEGRAPSGPVSWELVDPGLVSLAPSGEVRGLLPGIARIFVTAEGRRKSIGLLSILRFDEIQSGTHHLCGITSRERRFCWGDSRYQRPDNWAAGSTPIPHLVVPGPGDTLWLGEGRTYVLSEEGKISGWGDASSGCFSLPHDPDAIYVQPGTGLSELRLVGIAPGYRLVREVDTCSGGAPLPSPIVRRWSHGCGIEAGGKAWCWGDGTNGQLGVGVVSSMGPGGPVEVETDARFVEIAAALTSSCGRTAEGEVICWGLGGLDGPAGIVPGTRPALPTTLPGGRTFTSLVAGKFHFCGLDPLGAAFCWGDSREGALGDGSMGSSDWPVPVAGALNFRQIAASDERSCGLSTAGEVWCWGKGTAIPTKVELEGSFTRVVAGAGHACALRSDRVTLCWGDNDRYQLGATHPDLGLPPQPIYPESR